jgi:8-oxo-dGTP diphosphatase
MSVAYGGVLVDEQGRVLLREPSDHFGGYVWTFAKGTPDPGETPEQTALREVREETGFEAEVIGRLPVAVAGSTTCNVYFLMRPRRCIGEPDWETQSLRWVTPDEARALIEQTTNERGRVRDLTVLEAALRLLAVLTDPSL